MAKVLIITDVGAPQVNGVLITYNNLQTACEDIDGVDVEIFGPEQFNTIPLWFYPEIEGPIDPFPILKALKKLSHFDAVHIATEGTVGLVARLYFKWKKIPFTTAHHTRIPVYLERYLSMPQWMSYPLVKWFHNKSQRVFVIAKSGEDELKNNGLKAQTHVWKNGINLDKFPAHTEVLEAPWPRPIFAYCGRVSIEKDIHELLDLDLPGTKLIIGDGPAKESLEEKYPDAIFVGYKHGKELADHFAMADVFVFPSKSETLGLVMLESIASGTPVAAYPVNGPIDVINNGVSGFLGEDLKESTLACLELDRKTVANCAKQWDLHQSALDFLNHLSWIGEKPTFTIKKAQD